jgi:hypothetical protein
VEALDRGIALDPKHTGLKHLKAEMGTRKSPVIPFLHRDNPLNVSLGKMRRRKDELKPPASPGSSRPAR